MVTTVQLMLIKHLTEVVDLAIRLIHHIIQPLASHQGLSAIKDQAPILHQDITHHHLIMVQRQLPIRPIHLQVLSQVQVQLRLLLEVVRLVFTGCRQLAVNQAGVWLMAALMSQVVLHRIMPLVIPLELRPAALHQQAVITAVAGLMTRLLAGVRMELVQVDLIGMAHSVYPLVDIRQI